MKLYSTLVLLILAKCCLATNYYFSSASGNDGYTNAQASNPATPWKSIARLNAIFNTLAPGDAILFKRGETFYGGIIITKGGISFGAYGKGAKPVITGLSTISGWVSLGSNIWEAPVADVKPDVNLVLRNGAVQQVGRYPNADAPNGGYLAFTESTANSITGPASSSTTNWTGAEVAIRINRWNIRRQRVTAHEGGIVSFPRADFVPRVDYGYFFQRDARALDKDGEWWYDSVNHKLRVYSPKNPASYQYQVSTVDTLLGNNGHFSDIMVQDLVFTGAGRKAIWMYSGSNHTIKNVDIKFSGAEGISASAAFNVDVQYCTTRNCLASGIRLYNNLPDPVKLSVTHCTVDSTALLAGMEISNVVANGSNGVCVRGNKNIIEYNVITNSGYCGIEWQGNDVSIRYNVVERFCSVRDDGGGIYTMEGPGTDLPLRYNRKVVGNIVLYAIGANAGAKEEGSEGGFSARGLYFDEGTRYVLADSNTVAYCKGMAIHGNNNLGLTITNNVLFGNKGGYSFQRMSHGSPVRDMVVMHNIIYPYLFEYRNLAIDKPEEISLTEDITAIGTIDSNYYMKKNGDTAFTAITTNSNHKNYRASTNNISFLRSYQEVHSKEVGSGGTLYINKKATPDTISFKGTMKDLKGNLYKGQCIIPPYYAVVLRPGNAPEPPATPASSPGQLKEKSTSRGLSYKQAGFYIGVALSVFAGSWFLVRKSRKTIA